MNLSSREHGGRVTRLPSVAIADGRPEGWWKRAACRSMSPDIFDFGEDRGEKRKKRINFAKSVCAICPVKAECLADAKAHSDEGVRGGEILGGMRAENRAARDPRIAEKLERGETIRTLITVEVIDEVNRLLADGWTVTQVCAYTGYSKRTVHRYRETPPIAYVNA